MQSKPGGLDNKAQVFVEDDYERKELGAESALGPRVGAVLGLHKVM